MPMEPEEIKRLIKEKIPDAEFEKKFDSFIFKEEEGIKTREQLEKLCCDAMEKPMDLWNLPPYRFHYIEDYGGEKDTSIIVCMVHHSFCDSI